MGVSGLSFRFFLSYMGLMLLAGVVVSALGVKGVSGINVSGINIGVLAASVFWACSSYSKKNNRVISGVEKTKIVIAFSLINIFVQLLGALAVIGEPPLANKLGLVAASIGFAVLIQTVAIYFFIGLSQRLLIKQGVLNG